MSALKKSFSTILLFICFLITQWVLIYPSAVWNLGLYLKDTRKSGTAENKIAEIKYRIFLFKVILIIIASFIILLIRSQMSTMDEI